MNDVAVKLPKFTPPRFVVLRCTSKPNVNRAFGQVIGFADTKEGAVIVINSIYGESTFRYGMGVEYIYLYTPETDLYYALVPIE